MQLSRCDIDFHLPFPVIISMILTYSYVECKEYANLVYENETAPILRINAGSNKVSHCSIVETPLIVGGVKVKFAEFPHMVRTEIQMHKSNSEK